MEALRGLERFTALESEVEFEQFLEVVRRAIETLRSEDVLGSRAGAFARRGVNVVAVNSLAAIEFARVWILGCDRARVSAAGASGPDPARRGARGDLRAGRLAACAACGQGKRGGAHVRAVL